MHESFSVPNPLERLVALRRFELITQTLTLLLAVAWLRIPLEIVPMSALVILLALVNLATQWRIDHGGSASDAEIFGQLGIDVCILALLLYFSGGSANPFISLFLVTPTLAAVTLPAIYAWAMAAFTLLIYTGLIFWNLPLPPPGGNLATFDALLARAAGSPSEHAGHMNGFGLHVLGMWLNFVISVSIVAYFLTRMAAALRHREGELAAAREAALRHEQILALGTLAAGAAHKLGTPLGTMAIVLHELEITHADNVELLEDLGLLRQQVDHCKQTLTQILASAGQAREEGLSTVPLDARLSDLLEAWQVVRPQARLQTIWLGKSPAPCIAADRTLEQAILNLLDNAADAASSSGAPLHFLADWDAHTCRLEILDRGPGLNEETMQRIGQAFFSTKKNNDSAEESGGRANGVVGGLGIGFFLTRATIERLGGTVRISNRHDGAGACTRIVLPLA